jgi:hypothetical protein
MGEPINKVYSWARREKMVAGLFVALTLVLGILIGTIVSGRTSAMKTMAFAGKGATPLAVRSSRMISSRTTRMIRCRTFSIAFLMAARMLQRLPSAAWVQA